MDQYHYHRMTWLLHSFREHIFRGILCMRHYSRSRGISRAPIRKQDKTKTLLSLSLHYIAYVFYCFSGKILSWMKILCFLSDLHFLCFFPWVIIWQVSKESRCFFYFLRFWFFGFLFLLCIGFRCDVSCLLSRTVRKTSPVRYSGVRTVMETLYTGLPQRTTPGPAFT